MLILLICSLLHGFCQGDLLCSSEKPELQSYDLPHVHFRNRTTTYEKVPPSVHMTLHMVEKGFLTINPVKNPIMLPEFSSLFRKLSCGGVDNTVTVMLTGVRCFPGLFFMDS